MAEYGKKAGENVSRALHKRKQGTLKSGSGQTVKSRKQAIAIALSEAREAAGKVPAKKTARKTAATKKSRSRKSTFTRTARKTTIRKSPSRKSARKRTAAKKK